MSKTVRPVVVTTWDQQISYPWATSVTVSRGGDLRVYDGWQQRAYHPAGEWTSYTVAAAGTDLGTRAPWGRQTEPPAREQMGDGGGRSVPGPSRGGPGG